MQHALNYIDVMQYDEDKGGKVKAGDLMSKFFVIYETPADVRGTSQVKLTYLNSPIAKWRRSTP